MFYFDTSLHINRGISNIIDQYDSKYFSKQKHTEQWHEFQLRQQYEPLIVRLSNHVLATKKRLGVRRTWGLSISIMG